MDKEILDYDWGVITPDHYDKVKNVIVHAFCFDLRTEVKKNRSIKFAVGKVFWFNKHMPKNIHHDIVFDIRGLGLADSIIKGIENQVIEQIKSLDSKLNFSITFKQ